MSGENTELESDLGFTLNSNFKSEVEEKEEEKTEDTVEDKVEDENEDKVEEKEEEKTEDEVEEKQEDEPEDEVEEKQEDEPEEIDNSSLIRDEISKVTEGKYSSVEEMTQAYDDLNTKVSGKSLMENLNAQVEEAYGEGVTFSDLAEYKTRNFDEWDAMQLITENEQRKDPGISEAELKAELRPFDLLKRSKSEIDEMVEDEDNSLTRTQVDDLEARLMRKSREAKGDLKEFQNSINIDELQVSSPKPVVEPEESEQEIKDKVDYYKEVIGDLQELKVNVGTKESPAEVELKISEEDRNGIEEFLSADEGKNFVQKNWIEDDGVLNMDKLSLHAYKINNYDRDLKIAYTQGKSAGVKKEVEDIDNIDFKKGGSSAPKGEKGLSNAAKAVHEANS